MRGPTIPFTNAAAWWLPHQVPQERAIALAPTEPAIDGAMNYGLSWQHVLHPPDECQKPSPSSFGLAQIAIRNLLKGPVSSLAFPSIPISVHTRQLPHSCDPSV